MSQTATDTAAQIKFKRDEDGLVIGQAYRYTADGRVDWRAMLRSQDLYVKKDKRDEVVKRYGKALDDLDLTAIEDKYLCVTVHGINRLAHLRGIRSIEYPTVHISEGKAVAVCQIEFIGNYETEGLPIICSSMASATVRSVDPDFIPYIETFAENRAYARCVKRALQINILSDIEVGGEGKKRVGSAGTDGGQPDDDLPLEGSGASSGTKASQILAATCAKPPAPLTPITFDEVKKGALLYRDLMVDDPNTWTGFDSIMPTDAWTILGKIEEKAKAEVEAAAKPKKTGRLVTAK